MIYGAFFVCSFAMLFVLIKTCLFVKISVCVVKVPLIPKYNVRSNESLHLFERHCGHSFFLLLKNPAIL